MRLRSVDRCSLGRFLLRTHREAGDRESFDRWRDWLAPTSARDEEVRALVAHEEALWARDHLDLDSLATRVDAVRGPDVIRRGILALARSWCSLR